MRDAIAPQGLAQGFSPMGPRIAGVVFLAFSLCTAAALSASFLQSSSGELLNMQGKGDVPQMNRADRMSDVEIHVKGVDGISIQATAVVTLLSPTGHVLDQGTTVAGDIRFKRVAANEFTIQVFAPGYESAIKDFAGEDQATQRIIVYLKPDQDRKAAAASSRTVLSPKVQKELGKALEALRSNKPAQALSDLEAAYRIAPNQPVVNYLFGVYSLQMNDREKAKAYWARSLEVDPQYLSALLSLAEALVSDKEVGKAKMLLARAIEADPSSWRVHAILADVLVKDGATEEAINEANYALELGHGHATIVQPLLALALAKNGDRQGALSVLTEYVGDHPGDAKAGQQLRTLQSSDTRTSSDEEANPSFATETAIALPSNWLPPDVDDRVPPVQPGLACSADEVIQKAGMRVKELIANMDRFAASELLQHESISKWGLAGPTESRKFDYVVTIKEYKPGYFDVLEERGNNYSPATLPDGVETRGLASIFLIFHPSNAGNFAMTCEGLGLWHGTPAWQIHLRQRPDKPNTTRSYKLGESGPSYPVALRGRAWIAADSYQILRLETDLVDPLPAIRLFADHTVVEYGPVRFKDRDVELWLPQSAELYSEWRGKRMHRRHLLNNFVLFSVDEKQRISDPETETKSLSKNKELPNLNVPQ